MTYSQTDPKKQESKYNYDDIKSLVAQGESYWDTIFRQYTNDMIFSSATGVESEGEGQWDARSLAARGNRPAETYNIVNSFVRPVVNLARQNPPAVNVYPITDGASKTNAKLISGIIRAIEYSCGAQREYCDALESAVRGGLGVLRVIVRDVDNDDDIDFLILNEADPTKVFFDPSAKKQDRSDARWVVVKSKMSELQYRRDFPEGKAEGISGEVEIYEVWLRQTKKVKRLDPSTGYPKTVREVSIIQMICDSTSILEVVDNYPGKHLPFVLVSGPRVSVNDRVMYQSLTREIRGVQREINFLKSEQIAVIACAPKATFYGDNNAFDTEEERIAWEESATNPRVFLGHKAGASVNTFNFPQIPTTYITAVENNIDVARTITGIYPDPTVQNGLNAVSGKALKQQQAGQSVATYAFVDSLNFAVKRIGEIILDLLPHYWNDNRVRLSMGADGQYSSVSMGDQDVDEAENFDLAYGRYAVSISTGPSYASQKDALIEMLIDAIKTNPQAMTIALPWIINQVNLPGSEELADLFSLTLPPEIQQFLAQMKSESSDPEDKLRAALFQLQQMAADGKNKGQMIEKLTEALQQESAQLKSKEQEIQAKQQSDEQKNQVTLMVEQMRLESKREIEELKAQIKAMAEISKAHIVEASKDDARAHEGMMAEVKHEYAIDQIAAKTTADVVKAHAAPKAPRTPKKAK